MLEDGIVILYLKDAITDPITSGKITNGSFKINDVAEGEYTLLAIPDPVLTKDYLPTYYVNKSSIKDANTLYISGKTEKVDIQLLPCKKASGGSARIQGQLSSDLTIDTSSVYHDPWFGNDSIENTSANAIIQLKQNDSIVAWTISDNRGAFAFEQLPAGKYDIAIERAGWKFSEEESNLVIEPGLNTLDLVAIVDEYPLQASDRDLENNVKLFPNPFSDQINISYSSNVSVIRREVINSFGILINDAVANKDTLIETEELPTGHYKIILYFSDGRRIIKSMIKI